MKSFSQSAQTSAFCRSSASLSLVLIGSVVSHLLQTLKTKRRVWRLQYREHREMWRRWLVRRYKPSPLLRTTPPFSELVHEKSGSCFVLLFYSQTLLREKLRARRTEALDQLKRHSTDVQKVEKEIFASGQKLGAVLKENHR